MTEDVHDFLDRQARRSTPRVTLVWLEKHPIIKWWFDGDALALTTRYLYANSLRKLFDKLGTSPEDFMAALESSDLQKHRDMKVAVKSCIANYWRDLPTTANMMVNGLQALAKFHEIEPPFKMEQYRARRKRVKQRVTWDDVLAIIDRCPESYRKAFTFMLWGALDQNTFGLINSNAPAVRELNNGDLHAEIAAQMRNDKSYVRINLPPRKKSIDIYFILVPKAVVPTFPLLSTPYEGEKVKRGGSLITSDSLGNIWRTAARRSHIYHSGLGPHHTRVAFRTRCADLGIPEAAEWMMGRGGDIYGYDRSGFDEQFLIEGPKNQDGTRKGGLNVLWASAPTMDRLTVRAELESQHRKHEERIQELTARLEQMHKEQQQKDEWLNKVLIETTGYGIRQPKDATTGKPVGLGIYLADRTKIKRRTDKQAKPKHRTKKRKK